MLLSLRKKNQNKQTNKQTIKPKATNTQKQYQHIVAPVYITDGDAIRQLF